MNAGLFRLGFRRIFRIRNACRDMPSSARPSSAMPSPAMPSPGFRGVSVNDEVKFWPKAIFRGFPIFSDIFRHFKIVTVIIKSFIYYLY